MADLWHSDPLSVVRCQLDLTAQDLVHSTQWIQLTFVANMESLIQQYNGFDALPSEVSNA